jgi:hypothetical protein
MYDKSLDFGDLSLSGAGTAFPNILDLGETSVNRMTVDILAGDAAGGTSLAVTVQGTDDISGTPVWADVGKNTITLAGLTAGKGSVAVSPNAFRYLQVAVAKTGTFTAGTARAQLNTYVGK